MRRDFIDEFSLACKKLGVYQGAILSKAMREIIALSKDKTDIRLFPTSDVNEAYELHLANQRLEKQISKLNNKINELEVELENERQTPPAYQIENTRLREQNVMLKHKCDNLRKLKEGKR